MTTDTGIGTTYELYRIHEDYEGGWMMGTWGRCDDDNGDDEDRLIVGDVLS